MNRFYNLFQSRSTTRFGSPSLELPEAVTGVPLSLVLSESRVSLEFEMPAVQDDSPSLAANSIGFSQNRIAQMFSLGIGAIN